MGEGGHLGGQEVGGDGDQPLRAHGHHGDGVVVVAGPDVQGVTAAGDGLGQEGEVAGGLLDAVDPRVAAEDLIRLGGERQPRAGGDVVQDDRQVHPVGEVLIVPDEAGLGGLVVVRRDDQQRIGPGGLGVAAEGEGGGGVVAAAPGEDLAASGDVRETEVGQLLVLAGGERGALAGGAADAQGVDPGGELAVDLAGEGGVVDAAVVAEGGDEGGAGPGEDGSIHGRLLSKQTKKARPRRSQT